jgi:hypothetical protein
MARAARLCWTVSPATALAPARASGSSVRALRRCQILERFMSKGARGVAETRGAASAEVSSSTKKARRASYWRCKGKSGERKKFRSGGVI